MYLYYGYIIQTKICENKNWGNWTLIGNFPQLILLYTLYCPDFLLS